MIEKQKKVCYKTVVLKLKMRQYKIQSFILRMGGKNLEKWN